MNPRGLKAGTQPVSLGIRREPVALKVAMPEYFEVLAAREMSSLCEVEIKDINSRRDRDLFHLFARSLGRGCPGCKSKN
jgi:hypothetical protein